MGAVKTVVAEMMSQVVVTDTRQQAKVVYPLLPTVFASSSASAVAVTTVLRLRFSGKLIRTSF